MMARDIAGRNRLRRLHVLMALGLCAVTLAVFAGAAGHQFVHFDDRTNIYSNPHLKGLGGESLRWMFTDMSYARRYMPLGWLSYAVDVQFFGVQPLSFHLGNILLHAINSVLLFFFLRLVLARVAATAPASTTGAVPADHPSSTPSWCAALGALFWTVHPLRVETVAWASSRIYGVVFLLTLLWLLAWLRAQDTDISPPRRRMYYGLSLLAFAASLLTYPLAMFAPVVLVVLEMFVSRRVPLDIRQWWGRGMSRVWLGMAPFFVLAIGALVLTFVARMDASDTYRPTTLTEFGLSQRIMQAFYVWAYYLWKPWVPTDLSATYSALHAFQGTEPRFLLSAAAVVGLSGWLVCYRRRFPAALALWLCHLVLLVPALGVSEYPHSTYDRYSLLPAVFWSVAIAWLLLWTSRRMQVVPWRPLALAGAACFAAAVLAWKQVPVWRDTISLYEHIVARLGEHPSRSRFDEVLGAYYRTTGRTNEAAASFEDAIHHESRRRDRNIYDEGVLRRAHVRLADVRREQARPEDALPHYQTALQLDLTSVGVVIKLGQCLAELNRPDEALANLREAVRMQPDNPQAQQALEDTLKKFGRSRSSLAGADGEAPPSVAEPR